MKRTKRTAESMVNFISCPMENQYGTMYGTQLLSFPEMTISEVFDRIEERDDFKGTSVRRQIENGLCISIIGHTDEEETESGTLNECDRIYEYSNLNKALDAFIEWVLEV